MTIWIHLISNVWLAVLLYADDGELLVDDWSFRDGKHGPEISDGLVAHELVEWVGAHFAKYGVEAFNLRALYEMQLEDDGDAAA